MSIVKMKKVSIVVLNSERKASLKKLREVGLVHLEALEGKGPVLASYRETSSRLDKAIAIVEEIKLPKKEARHLVQKKLSNQEAERRADEIVSLSDRKKSLLDSINQNVQELDRFTKWGTVNPDDFAYLAGKGIFLYMYEIPLEKYALVGEICRTILVNSVGKIARFMLISESELTERPAGLPPEAYAVPLPEKSSDAISSEVIEAEKEISSIEKKLAACKEYRDGMDAYRKVLAKQIEFESVYSGMGREEDAPDAAKSAKALESETVEQALEAIRKEEADTSGKLAWLSGYVPVDSIKDFAAACKLNHWAYAIDDPDDDDADVPTKLKNNKLVSLIYPLTDFLGTVPGYHEFDISAWFLLFFTLFFGMIFGDGGYGLIITAAALFMLIKNLASKKKNPPLVGLMLLVGLATVAWGTVTCTWFGIDPKANVLPAWLTGLSIPQISSAYSDAVWRPVWITDPGLGLTKDQNLQIFCFALALLQLSIAHIKAAARNISLKKGLKALGDIGSLLQLVGMFWVVLSMVVDGSVFPMLGSIGPVPVGKIEISLIAVGFVLSFVFANYEGSIGQSVLESCKNIISVLLGVVNVFSDIVSYIRLWAVGLAGAAISNTVNTLAGPMLGHAILFVAAVALLLFGHGLNMVLNLLSVIVHGVRLNTLEFSSHMGVSWSGIKYSPFSEK